MNSTIFYLLSIFFIFDFQNESKVKYLNSVNLSNDHAAYKELLDTANSIIFWKGTKLLYTRSHLGEVKFKAGELLYKNEKLVGGWFEADMKTIKVTDIPIQDISPFTNLTNHLNSDFDVNRYATAFFEIERIDYQNKRSMRITGRLIIMGITQNISFDARIDENEHQYRVKLVLSRTKWHIGKKGSWLEQKLVDDEFEIRVVIRV